ncbi:MAG: diol dehydratase small subunit [Tissierellia bacterium]|nr:diol dehydratase small subunit [Tissierellia bacterium]
MDNKTLEQMIKEVMETMTNGEKSNVKTEASPKSKMPTNTATTYQKKDNTDGKYGLTTSDYPLIENRPELVKTPTNLTVDDLTLEGVVAGKITNADLKIRPETLYMQAEIAEDANRKAFARNLRRAAELIAVPDEKLLEIYNALRPNRSSKEELLAIADELESKYDSKINSKLIREAAEVYEKRDILRID